MSVCDVLFFRGSSLIDTVAKFETTMAKRRAFLWPVRFILTDSIRLFEGTHCKDMKVVALESFNV